jgi:hypothetical protein
MPFEVKSDGISIKNYSLGCNKNTDIKQERITLAFEHQEILDSQKKYFPQQQKILTTHT